MVKTLIKKIHKCFYNRNEFNVPNENQDGNGEKYQVSKNIKFPNKMFERNEYKNMQNFSNVSKTFLGCYMLKKED